MATIKITYKDATTFTMNVGLITVDKVKEYHAFETTGEYIRAEQIGTEHSDLFNPIHFSEIEIDGVVYGSTNETVTALNDLIYTNETVGSGGAETVTILTDNSDSTYTYVSEDSTNTTFEVYDPFNYRSFDITQWSKDISLTPITITNAISYNLLDDLLESDKTSVSSTNTSALNITEDLAGQNYIQFNYQNRVESIFIRVILEVEQNAIDFFRIILRRKSDDSVISVHPLVINAADVPEKTVTCNIETYLSGVSDSFVTGGLYIQFANNSGQDIDLENNINILIKRVYQNQIKN